jgi:hypothetical protein
MVRAYAVWEQGRWFAGVEIFTVCVRLTYGGCGQLQIMVSDSSFAGLYSADYCQPATI